MSNKCLFQQSAGLGDLIWLLRAHDLFIIDGYKITWPINPSLMYIKDYLWNDVNFVPIKHHTQVVDYDTIVPFQSADQYFPGESVLKSKYKLIGCSWEGWQAHFLLKRNREKEEELFNRLCPDGPYTVICRRVGTYPNFREQDIYYEKNGAVVEITEVEGFNPFDYGLIFERATAIGCVDSCWQYIIEKLDIQTEKLWLTSRFQPSNFMHIDGLFKQPWKFIK